MGEEPSYRAAAVSSTRITILPIQSILLILSFLKRVCTRELEFSDQEIGQDCGMGRMGMVSKRTKRP